MLHLPESEGMGFRQNGHDTGGRSGSAHTSAPPLWPMRFGTESLGIDEVCPAKDNYHRKKPRERLRLERRIG